MRLSDTDLKQLDTTWALGLAPLHQIEATRGKRLNVLAALMSTGELVGAKLWQSTTADAFVGFVHRT